MDAIKLSQVLADHERWLGSSREGERADLSGVNLSGADLSGADLSDANLSRANLSGADLSYAGLSGANLGRANLSRANLSRAKLSGANLSGADLSGSRGLLGAASWMAEFERDDLGVIVYRVERGSLYVPPEDWEFRPGAFLVEVPNRDPCLECASGVHFATLPWVKRVHPNLPVWRCRIRWMDLAGVVVPYNTNGKARCARLELMALCGAEEDRAQILRIRDEEHREKAFNDGPYGVGS